MNNGDDSHFEGDDEPPSKGEHDDTIMRLPEVIRYMDDTYDDIMMRLADVMHVTGLCRSSVYQLMGEDRFPRNRKVRNISVWSRRDIKTYIRIILAGGKYRASVYHRSNYSDSLSASVPGRDDATAATTLKR